MLTRLTNRLSNGLYNIAKKRSSPANYLPLYRSKVFTSTSPSPSRTVRLHLPRQRGCRPLQSAASHPPHQRTNHSTQQSGLYPARFLYTSLGFDPENEVLKVVSLRSGSFHTQEFSINSVIPWSYRGKCPFTQVPLSLGRHEGDVEAARAPSAAVRGRRDDLLEHSAERGVLR